MPSNRGWALPSFVTSFFVLLGAPIASAHGASQAEIEEPVTYYVHGFDDPAAHDYAMDTTPPTDETPQTEPCTECVGDPALFWNFTSPPAPFDVAIHDEGPVLFEFWVKGYEPAEGAALPPGNVTLRFMLDLDSGERMASASKVQDLTAPDATRVTASAPPELATIPAGSQLVWRVELTGFNNAYLPTVVPYGVGPDNPFSVSFTRVAPVANATVEIHAANDGRARVLEGGNAVFNLTVDNHGSRTILVALAAQNVPAGANATLTNVAGTPITGAFSLGTEEPAVLTLTVSGLDVGNHTIKLVASGSRGEHSETLLLAQVEPPPPVATQEGGGGLPGFEFAFLALALVGAAALWRRRA